MSDHSIGEQFAGKLDNWREYTNEELRELHQQRTPAQWNAVCAEMEVTVATLLAKHESDQQAIVDEFIASLSPAYEMDNPPPGFAGELANAIFQGSYKPVSAIATAATLGLLAGVCGRAFEIPTGKDCALYILLVAKSGVGKEALHESIPAMIELSGILGAYYFVHAVDFASGPALHKQILEYPGFLCLAGEYGKKLRRMANERDAPMQELRSVITLAYAKDFLGGIQYSNAEKSMPGVKWPAYSQLGETTPGTFYDSLTQSMMEDGFISRFNVIVSDGDWQEPNEGRQPYQLDDEQLQKWRSIITRALPYQGTSNTPEKRIPVEYGSESTEQYLKEFETECGMKTHGIEDESERQVYTRAAIKAYKIASLLAIADNPVRPRIYLIHAKWAVDMIRRDIAVFIDRKESGDVGSSDNTRIQKVKSILSGYIKGNVAPSYKVDPRMVEDGVLPRDYIQKRIGIKSSAFNAHPQGHIAAINVTIKNLIDDGNLMQINKDKAIELYGFHGKCFRILKVD